MLKKFFSFFLTAVSVLLLSGCGNESEIAAVNGLNIVTSVFPACDFVREIAGDCASVTLLIPPGTEIHGFEPTPQDIIRIENCDVLVCNGGESEEWLEEILEGCDRDITVVRMMDCVETVEEETREGMQSVRHAHSHEQEEYHDDHEESCEQEHEHEHEKEYDEHVWSSPVNAALICEEICRVLCDTDKENAAYYTRNCGTYAEKLEELDAEIRETVDKAANRTLVFADRFPVRYFIEEYGLDYYAAFPGCAEDTEPSAKTVAFLIDRVRERDLPAVFYIEFSNGKMADIICEDTGCQKLLFHSCQNVSSDEFKSGVTYLELMEKNADNLREALG